MSPSGTQSAAAAAADDDDDDDDAVSVNSMIISMTTAESLVHSMTLSHPVTFTLSHIHVCLHL